MTRLDVPNLNVKARSSIEMELVLIVKKLVKPLILSRENV